MAAIDIAAGFRREAARLGNLRKGSVSAVQRATGTLARRLPVEARRDIQEEYNLPAARITEGLAVRRGEGYVELVGRARGVGLVNFGARQTAAGVTVQVFKGGARKTIPQAFITEGKFGNRQIFIRQRIGGHRAGRLPIETFYGPSIASMVRKPGRSERLGDIARQLLSDEIDRLLNANG